MVRVRFIKQYLKELNNLEEEVNTFLSGKNIYEIRSEIVGDFMYVFIIFDDGSDDVGCFITYEEGDGETDFKN